jgi:putative ABC transport system ATP-binding protein
VTSPPVIKTVNLVRIYQNGGVPVPAVRGVDLCVEPGEFVAIMGPSGSGKSTLVHMLGGLDARTSGEIWLDGRRVDTLSESAWALLRRQKIGFVFQFFNLLPTMTARENVMLPALLEGMKPAAAARKADALLERVGLGGRGAHHPDELSGGEMQRVAIARALVKDAPLLLADEPTGNLDSATGQAILALLRELHRDGLTLVMVTHDAVAASIAGGTLRLSDGRIVEDTRGAEPRAAAGA